MKLLLFDDYQFGVLKGDHVVDVSTLAPDVGTLAHTPLGGEAVMDAVPEAQALDYVFGYVNFSDISARAIPTENDLPAQSASAGQIQILD